VLTAAPFKIWDTIKQFHPHKKEILNVVGMLNRIGVNRNIIAATLGLQKWKTFYGVGEWTEEDVKDILADITKKDKSPVKSIHNQALDRVQVMMEV
jgi:hypothetical protein